MDFPGQVQNKLREKKVGHHTWGGHAWWPSGREFHQIIYDFSWSARGGRANGYYKVETPINTNKSGVIRDYTSILSKLH